MDPVSPLARSFRAARTPSGVSWMRMRTLSPDRMNRSLCLFGVYVARVDWSWLAGACATPFFVTNANWNVSIPTCAWQVGFWSVPFTGSSRRLNTFMAAHHWFGLQVPAPMACAQVGHGTHPGG